ncbi:MAG: CDP-diacylglycerol--serine O-phosphatidyltransferase [Verrucomicrobia bacterium]|nr:CDP-diacylglycerol--serine O-phosphatidyltransferase [Verrucomicrobiota bacterium]
MAVPSTPPDASSADENRLRIYFLPNLMTAGNLFCGFLAITRIVESQLKPPYPHIKEALFYILLACIFDLLDGRLARMGGKESPFGREFDSLADVVSFGVAPAFLVHRIVLKDVFEHQPQVGWFIASVYLICGALRLARFNCLSAMPNRQDTSGDFLGLPIPAAAGTVASITLFIMWLNERPFGLGTEQGNWRYVLPVILLFLSFMMVSEVRYPSFKKIDWRTKRPFTKMVVTILVVGFFIILWDKILPIALPLFFTIYLIYCFIRPRLSRQMRHDIEDEDEDTDEDTNVKTPP